jgi:hypothetical protein
MARTKCDEQKHNGATNTRTNDTWQTQDQRT